MNEACMEMFDRINTVVPIDALQDPAGSTGDSPPSAGEIGAWEKNKYTNQARIPRNTNPFAQHIGGGRQGAAG